MIDPTNITNYNLTVPELEEHILWWVCAAGKNGVVAAKCLDKLLKNLRAFRDKRYSPFDLVKYCDVKDLERKMYSVGIGCYTIKSKTFKDLAESKLDLKTCSVDDLEKIKGIGPKTARCFIIHSRPNQQLAGLDRHILSWLSDLGYKVPKSTPTGSKYKKIEQWFLAEVKKSGKTVSELDLEIWNNYRIK